MKRLFTVFMILMMVLVGCASKEEDHTTVNDNESTTAVVADMTEPTSVEPATEETDIPLTEPTGEETQDPTAAPPAPEKPTEAVITVDYPNSALIESGEYNYFLCGDKEYAVQVAISINQRVTDLTLSSIVITEEGDELVPVYTLDEFTPEKPIVADLSFPGDMSAYAISYIGDDDVVYIYAIYQSGMDGSIVLTDYVPFIV